MRTTSSGSLRIPRSCSVSVAPRVYTRARLRAPKRLVRVGVGAACRFLCFLRRGRDADGGQRARTRRSGPPSLPPIPSGEPQAPVPDAPARCASRRDRRARRGAVGDEGPPSFCGVAPGIAEGRPENARKEERTSKLRAVQCTPDPLRYPDVLSAPGPPHLLARA